QVQRTIAKKQLLKNSVPNCGTQIYNQFFFCAEKELKISKTELYQSRLKAKRDILVSKITEKY
ncbi:MAG: hypothetical protein AAFQ14_17455, partial [Cyanobacteria bacterium J06621_12]